MLGVATTRELIARAVQWAVPFRADIAWKTQNDRLVELENDFNELQHQIDDLGSCVSEFVDTQIHG